MVTFQQHSLELWDSFHKELWATIISYVVILFPVATTTTGYPLIGTLFCDHLLRMCLIIN